MNLLGTLRSILKSLVPAFVRKQIRFLIKMARYQYRYWKIKRATSRDAQLKIIVGAAETKQPSWFSTNEQWLDITNEKHWKDIFRGRKILTHVLAEHVFEHLTEDEALVALKHIKAHLGAGGKVRIAVPDGYNPNEEYIRHVGINGIGDDAADHKQLLNSDSLQKLLQRVGFKTELIEGYTNSGELVVKPWSPDDGDVIRSRQKEQNPSWTFVDASTSLIVDGVLTSPTP